MLLTVAIILLVLWALGYFALEIAGGLLHLLLILAIVALIWNFAPRRRTG